MFQGAEAEIEFEEDKVIKKRKPKSYRHKDLDKRIRDERTSDEERIINRAHKYGVNVPKAEEKGDTALEIEKIEGEMLKNVLNEELSLMKEIGEDIRLMHTENIIHGDLTTSNILVTDKNKHMLIDFGLSMISDRVEDKAVDLHLLKEVLRSSHPEISEKAWQKFKEGYSTYEESKEILEQLKDVESRGRYK